MHILLFGKNGQVGWELQRALAPLGKVTAVDVDSVDYCGDFSNLAGIAETVRRVKPTVIVNGAAYTNVDQAEHEPARAMLINATAVELLANEAKQLGAWLVHYSSDYVFSGEGEQPWRESDEPAPLNVYGSSKLAGEQAAAQCQRHLIFRTSWVYAARGKNFAKTILQLAQERSELTIINDQIGAPTGAELLADCTTHAIVQAQRKPELAGLYHLSAAGATSWYEYAKLVIATAGEAGIALRVTEVNPVASSAFPRVATRPHNSRLDTQQFQHAFKLELPAWQLGVARMLAEMFGP